MLDNDLIKKCNMVSFPSEVTSADILNWFISNANFFGYKVFISEPYNNKNINLILKKIMSNDYYECYLEISECKYEEGKILCWVLTPIK